MVTQDIEIKASPKQCYKVISDYKNYPKFISDLKQIEVKNKKGNNCEITYHVNLIKEITYTLKMKGKPDKRIEWSFVGGDFMKDNHGHWEFKEIKKGLTRATYTIDVRFGMLVPKTVTKMLVGKNLPAMLKSFKKRIESEK